MITKKTREKVIERANNSCEGCGVRCNDYTGEELHHAHFRSQYHKDDRDDPRNLVLLCSKCHHELHNGDTKLKKRLQLLSMKRKDVQNTGKTIVSEGVPTGQEI